MFQRPASASASQELPSHHSLLNLKLGSLGDSFEIVLLYLSTKENNIELFYLMQLHWECIMVSRQMHS